MMRKLWPSFFVTTQVIQYHSFHLSSLLRQVSPFVSNYHHHHHRSNNRFIMSASFDISSSTLQQPRFADIGANLLDDRYTKGIYRGTFRHEPDLDLVMERSVASGVRHLLLTAGTIEESRAAVQAVREWRTLYPQMTVGCTVGVHPTRCQQVFVDHNTSTAEDLLQELLEIALDGMKDKSVLAIGEIGLDYERLEFCPKEVQKEFLVKQLQHVAKPTGLPLFLHNRNVGTDLHDILHENKDCWTKHKGVVHSFDDTLELAELFLPDFYIGLNGCSLRTNESLDVVKELPLNRILLETDCPYCEVRAAHPGYAYIQTHFEAKAEKKYEREKCVKSRQEPCHIIQVAEVIAGVKQLPLLEVSEACFQNSVECFFSQV